MTLAEVRPDALIALPAQCGTAAAESLRGALLSAAESGAIRLDASQVGSLGQSVLQILLAARRSADASGLPFDITSPSAAFSETLARCGLADAFQPLSSRSAAA